MPTPPRCMVAFQVDRQLADVVAVHAEQAGMSVSALCRAVIAERFGYDPHTIVGRNRTPVQIAEPRPVTRVTPPRGLVLKPPKPVHVPPDDSKDKLLAALGTLHDEE